MHISDGLIANNWGITAAIIMWILSASILIWSWRKAKTTYSRSISAILAISSAFVFAAQMINFPIIFGTSGAFSRRHIFSCSIRSICCHFEHESCLNNASGLFC